MAARERHQTKTKSGTLAHIRINGVLHRQHFNKSTEPFTIKKWLLTTEMRYRGRHGRKTGKFEDDARAYLESVKAMPTYVERVRHIEEWIAVFGDTLRDAITGDDIRATLNRWRTEPRTVTVTRRITTKAPRTRELVLSASAVNKRRTALQHLFTVLDGKAAPNPVRDVPKFREPDAQPKGVPYTIIRAIFAAMPDTVSRARLMVIAYTGIPHAQLAQIQPEDVQGSTVKVQGRRKGKGTALRIVPLSPDGVRAFKAMARTDAWGLFSRSSLRQALRRACMALGLPMLTPYDLRHSFGTEVYRTSGDMRATQVLMGHSSPTLTHRYTLAAVDQRVAEALKWFGKRRVGTSLELSLVKERKSVGKGVAKKHRKTKKSGASGRI